MLTCWQYANNTRVDPHKTTTTNTKTHSLSHTHTHIYTHIHAHVYIHFVTALQSEPPQQMSIHSHTPPSLICPRAQSGIEASANLPCGGANTARVLVQLSKCGRMQPLLLVWGYAASVGLQHFVILSEHPILGGRDVH